MSEIISSGMKFFITGTETRWANYGVTQRFGAFDGRPNRYQVVSIDLATGTQNIVKSPTFIPIPTEVSRRIVHNVAKELDLEIKQESNDGMKYFANLVSQVKGEVEVGDIVSWGIAVTNSVAGNFRIDASMLRLVCSNGMMRAEDSEMSSITKTYDLEKMEESFLDKARALQDTFEEKLELFRSFKQYKMNQQFAELLAKSFPSPIIKDVVTVGKKKAVESFSQKNLWQAYNDITYQLSHRNLKVSTRFSWSLKATKIFEDYIKEQAQTS